ncbi:arogenate dehydratase/prephenate dehydratase 1, chloroplastic isoform X3 [Coffea arabica]|uniref:Arogenate dehydratase/prephenate dehydratase 1, chloroplastic isoform X3 n=1 Tax=Coffea arabica TaxID=13443 RepID=A0ABM4UI60_COFAR
MAVKNLINLGCLFPQVGCAQFSEKPSVYACLGLKCSEFIGFSGNHAIRCLGDQNCSSNSASELPSVVDNRESSLANKLQKDLTSLPRPLSVSDFSTFPSHGSKVRVSFKGEPGSYSEDAALKAYPQCETVPCNEFEDAFKAVELWIADRAVLPIENSLSGSIHRNYDLLLRHRLHIVGEVQLPVNFCLLALPGIPLERLKRVLSHPQALAQSDNFLSKLGVVRENFEDTAGAAQLVVSKRMFDAGVIATARAAEIYGLNIVAKAIQDEPDNFTRFIILARDPIIPRTDKAFKIESRPQRKQPLRVVDDSNNGTAKYFDYLFYIDFEASMAESRAQNALGHLQQEFATFLRILGSYPIDAAA